MSWINGSITVGAEFTTGALDLQHSAQHPILQASKLLRLSVSVCACSFALLCPIGLLSSSFPMMLLWGTINAGGRFNANGLDLYLMETSTLISGCRQLHWLDTSDSIWLL